MVVRERAHTWVVAKGQQRLAKLEAEVGIFVQKYARKKHAGHDPNDRTYDREVERVIKKMDPRDLDELLRGELDEDDAPPGH